MDATRLRALACSCPLLSHFEYTPFTRRLFPWSLRANMTLSIKSEVHNVSHPAEDRATIVSNMHKKLVNSGRVVSEICSQTDRRIDSARNTGCPPRISSVTLDATRLSSNFKPTTHCNKPRDSASVATTAQRYSSLFELVVPAEASDNVFDHRASTSLFFPVTAANSLIPPVLLPNSRTNRNLATPTKSQGQDRDLG